MTSPQDASQLGSRGKQVNEATRARRDCVSPMPGASGLGDSVTKRHLDGTPRPTLGQPQKVTNGVSGPRKRSIETGPKFRESKLFS